MNKAFIKKIGTFKYELPIEWEFQQTRTVLPMEYRGREVLYGGYSILELKMIKLVCEFFHATPLENRPEMYRFQRELHSIDFSIIGDLFVIRFIHCELPRHNHTQQLVIYLKRVLKRFPLKLASVKSTAPAWEHICKKHQIKIYE